MKNFTNNFKQFTSRLSARWLIMALMMLVGTSSAWAWSYKLASSNWSCKGKTGWSDVALYTTPTGNSKQNLSVAMLTNPGDGFNILMADNCNEWNGSDHNHCLYVGLSGTAATNTSTIVRATAYWNNGLYSKYTVVVPGGKVYIKPTGGNEVEMTKDSYTYTASVSLSSAQTFDLYGASVTTSNIQNQWDMPSGGKPSSVRLNYTNLTSPYQYVKITYDLKTNQITFTEEAAPCTPPDAPTLTNPAAQCGGSITLPESANELNLKWYDAQTGGNVVSNTEITATETYWAAAVTECESTDRTAYTITINPVPSFTVDPTNLSLCKGSTSVTDLTELSHVVVENGDPVWYDAETAGNVVTTGADLENGGTYWVAAENNETGCVNTERKSFTLKIYDLPKYPDLTKTSAVVCQADETVNLNTLAGVNDVIWYQGEDEVQKPDEISIDEEGIFTYTAKAVNVNGCQSATGVDFKLTVNPLPTINIGEDVTAVLYEDVVLTATGENIDKVEWTVNKGTITEDATDPKKAVLTYDQADAVTVTATATSADDCTSTATKTVTFGAENCNSTTRTDLIITCNPNGYYGDVYLHIWPNGESSLKEWPGYQGKWVDDAWKWEIPASSLSTSKQYDILFHNNEGAQTKDLDHNLVPGNQYNYTLNHTDWGNGNNRPTMAKVNPIPLSQPAAITAPAVKTVSVTSDEDGNVTMVGQVVKTGCDTQAILGLQYKKQKQDGTYDDNYTTYPNPGTKEAISAGKTFTVTTKLEDGTYKVRARIDNSHATNGYGEDIIVVVNTVKTPISEVAIDYSDIDGNEIADPNPMCKGAIAYVKLSYVGSKYSDIKWLVEGVETKLVTDEGDGVWSYIIQGDGRLSVELKNDANTDPAWPSSNKLPFTIIPEPTVPYISIDPASGVICEGSEATIKVENPSKDCSYKLVEEGSKAGFMPYESGDLKYTVRNVAKYYVVAQHNACTANEYTSNQVAINQIISTSAKISIEPNDPKTTPWEPVTITVKPAAGYIYELTYTDGNLAAVDGVRIKQNGDSYTYYIPRPDAWTTGDRNPVRTPINYGIKAQLKVDGEASQCQLNAATATIQLKDEDNENCSK